MAIFEPMAITSAIPMGIVAFNLATPLAISLVLGLAAAFAGILLSGSLRSRTEPKPAWHERNVRGQTAALGLSR